ncbi:hypothetical protein FEV16_13280 [Methylocystis sp. B8]|nr:hypothetical protein FEV16_13280 [Methylocystis sp. B8]
MAFASENGMRARGHEFSRRKLMIGCALGALMPCIIDRAVFAKTSGLADFLRLSVKLTGRSHLSVDTARIYLHALELDRSGSRADFGRLNKEDSDRLARRIVADWYSGQTVDSGRMICVDYTGALMWDAIGFARPGGVLREAASWALAPIEK